MPYRCKDCRKHFSVKIGTAMQSSNLGYQKWAIAIYLVATNLKGVSSMKLHRDLKIRQPSAWHLAQRIREGFDLGEFIMAGPVEVDETYIGGRERNKHASKKLRKGRGSVGKTAVVGIKDRPSNFVFAEAVDRANKKTLRKFIGRSRGKEAPIYTDDSSVYSGLKNHEAVCHSVGEFVRGMAHTNGVESFWALLKRGYYGTYHKLSAKHLNRYVQEFAGRHNIRGLDTAVQMSLIAQGLENKRLRYEDLTA